MDRLQYFYGKDYELIPKKLFIRHPRLLDILKIGQDRYNIYISALTMTSLHMADILYEQFNLWYEDVSNYQLFIESYVAEIKNNEENKVIFEALKFFTGLELFPNLDKNGNVVLATKDFDVVINEITFNVMTQFIKDINFVNEAEIYEQLKKAGSKGTAKYILKQIASRRKLKSNETVDLQSICSSLMWKSGLGEEIFKYPIYRIYEGYARLNSIDNWDKTVPAYYAGTIDTEKSPINLEKINWTRILK